jgi:phage terminase large subunit GpA-like protein
MQPNSNQEERTMGDVTIRQVIHRDLPENLLPKTDAVKEYIHSKLTNHGQGGNGEYTYWGNDESWHELDELLDEFTDDMLRRTHEEQTSRADTALVIRDMRIWVRNMKAEEEPFDIIIYR